MFRKGDAIIYRKPKRSERPGPRAINIRPVSHGDEYHYEVDKFWRVLEVNEAEIVITTPGGKVHKLHQNDPHIHKPSFFKAYLLRDRFPAVV